MKQVLRDLEKVLDRRQILENEPMASHTTFRVGGPADFFLTPMAGQLQKTLEVLSGHEIPVTVIGNGSNLLVADSGIRGAVIEIGRQMSEITVEGERLRVQAGALLSKAAQEAYQNGLSGMEFAAGIPGSAGGAMVMNAGAYGGEIGDITESVQVLGKNGSILELTKKEMEFGYRRSCIAEKGYLALGAVLKLNAANPEEIRKKMEDLKEQRLKKQPLEYPSAGSTFKRPEGYFAGKLIMDAGLSGYASGGAAVSEKHCGFVINRGNATAGDILNVIRHVQRTVQEKFGIELHTEVKLIGEF